MKRINNLFDKICTIDNINLADENARKGKVKSRKYIKIHDQKKYEDNVKLLQDMISHNFKTSPYSLFTIYEPKERIIARLPYCSDRIYQHALMNILKPIWQSRFIKNTYSCIEGRGIHKCANDLKRALRKHPNKTAYCLKLDVHKFYPSIQHNILKISV